MVFVKLGVGSQAGASANVAASGPEPPITSIASRLGFTVKSQSKADMGAPGKCPPRSDGYATAETDQEVSKRVGHG